MEKTESCNQKEVELVKLDEKKFFIKYIDFIKNYFSLISFSILAILLIFDYFIFTDVLNLNQAYFFNNLLGVIAQEQPILLIFILLPILFTLLIFIILYKIQFDYLNKSFNNNYRNAYNTFNKFKITFIFLGILAILFGDIVVFFILNIIFNILENTPFKVNTFSFIFTTYFLFLIYNSIVFYLILILSSIFILKFKNLLLFSFLLFIFITLKLAIYPLSLQHIPDLKENSESFAIFILFNLIFFIPAIISIFGKNFKEKKEKKEIVNKNKKNKWSTLFNKFFFIILIILIINFYFFYLNKIYQEPYILKNFWDKLPKDSLFNNNISLLISPLKILRDTENEMNIEIKDIKEKFINKFDDKNLNEKFNSNSNLNYFYLPFKDYRIIFIQEDTNEDIILTAYTLFKDDKCIKILDVGFIDLNSN